MKGKGTQHAFSEIYIHFNWHCKNDRPLIRPEVEPVLQDFLRTYCNRTPGIDYMSSGNTEDHVHLVFRMEPTIRPSEFFGQIKGASSHEVNTRCGFGTLEWQRGYGAVSFAKRHLAGVVRYAELQKEHHREGTTREVLERRNDYEEFEERDEEQDTDREEGNG